MRHGETATKPIPGEMSVIGESPPLAEDDR
jgi:hypothetical protein